MTTSRVLRWLRNAVFVLLAWLAILIAMPFIGPADRTVAVVGPSGMAIEAIGAAGGRVVDIRNGAVLAKGEGSFAWRLYRSGAPMVIEGRIAAGCFSQRK